MICYNAHCSRSESPDLSTEEFNLVFKTSKNTKYNSCVSLSNAPEIIEPENLLSKRRRRNSSPDITLEENNEPKNYFQSGSGITAKNEREYLLGNRVQHDTKSRDQYVTINFTYKYLILLTCIIYN